LRREDADTAEENAKRTDKHSSSANHGEAVGNAVVTPIDGKDGVDIRASAVGSGFDGDQQRSTRGRSCCLEMKNISRPTMALEFWNSWKR